MKMNPVVHFEMPYENSDRLAKFYTQVFGWQMQKFGSDMGDYVTAATTETDENRMVKTPGLAGTVSVSSYCGGQYYGGDEESC